MRFGLITVLIVFCFVPPLLGQSEGRDRRAIAEIKNIQVPKLDKRLPAESFARWFAKVVGKGQKIDWEVNDCGEQDGSGRQKDFPICVQAAGKTADLIQISVSIAVGTHKRGIVGKPVIWGIWVEAEPEISKILDELNQLPKELTGIRRNKNEN